MKRLTICCFLVIFLSVQIVASGETTPISSIPPWVLFNFPHYIRTCNASNNIKAGTENTALISTFAKLSEISCSFSKLLSDSSEITTKWQTNASTMVQAALIVHLEDFVMKMALRLQGVALYAMGKEQTLFHTPQSHMLELQNSRTFNDAEKIFKLTISWLKDLTVYSTILNPSSATSLSNQWLAVNRIIRVSVRNSQVTQIDPRLVAALDATLKYLKDVIEVTKVFVDYARKENFALTNLNQWNSLYGMISELHTNRRDLAVLDNVHLYNAFSGDLETILEQFSSFKEQLSSTNLATQLNTFERSMKQVMNYALLTLKNSILYTDRLKSYSIIVTSNYFQRSATAAFWRLKFKDNVYFIKVVLEQSAQIDSAGMKSDTETTEIFSEFCNIGASYAAVIEDVQTEFNKCTPEEIRRWACLIKFTTASRAAIRKAYAANTEESRILSAAIRQEYANLAATNRKLYADGYKEALLF